MGCPGIFYTRTLQCLSHALAYDTDKRLAEELMDEKSEERLENYILDKKQIVTEKEFYYYAGRTTEYVLNEADEESCDSYNAACGGISRFENFIGLRKDDD